MTPDELLKWCEQMIAKHGVAFISTATSDKRSAALFTYTVGLIDRGWPELIIFGLAPHVARDVLRCAVDLAAAQRAALPTNTRIERVLVDLPVVALPVAPEAVPAHFGVALARAQREDIAAVQIVWPDAAGRFPWETGFNEGLRASQPLLAALH